MRDREPHPVLVFVLLAALLLLRVLPGRLTIAMFGVAFCAAGVWFFLHPEPAPEMDPEAHRITVSASTRSAAQRPIALLAIAGGLLLVTVSVLNYGTY